MDSPRSDNNNELITSLQQMLERNVQMFSLMAQLMRHSNNHNEVSSRFSQLLEAQSQLMHEINHMANGSHKPACKICGDIGHTHTEHKDQCPNCDAHHPNSQCPTSLVTCFLCEGISEFEIDYTEQELNDLLALEKPKKNKCKNQKINVPSYTSNPKPSKVLVKKDLSHITCRKCKKTGHYADKCSQRKTEVIAKPHSGYERPQ